ncbi:unnamed protein product [Rotaria sp. Silwood2]|nr:unnamed protein product [Rotaria sp. Silwood2]
MHYKALFSVPNGTSLEHCCDQITNGEIQILDSELEALAMIYKKTICLIQKEENKSVQVTIDYFGISMSSDTSCVYILYNNKMKKFDPLYVTTKLKSTERITIFNCNDNMVKFLLGEFIRNDLKYKGYIKIDGCDDINVDKATYPADDLVKSKPVPISITGNDNIISSHDQKITCDKILIPNIYDSASFKHENQKENDEHILSHSVTTKQQSLTRLKRDVHKQTQVHQLEINQRSVVLDNRLSRGTMSEISEATHEFYRKAASRDGDCLFWSVGYLHDLLETLTTKHMRDAMVKYISKDENLKTIAITSIDNCKDIKDYYARARSNLYGGDFEILALAKLYKKLIILISININKQDEPNVNISYYDDETSPFFECIYILYDDVLRHFDPLIVINKKNKKEEFKIFEHGDPTIRNLIIQFIREDLKFNERIKFPDQTEISCEQNVTQNCEKHLQKDILIEQSMANFRKALLDNRQPEEIQSLTKFMKKFLPDVQKKDTSNYNHDILEAEGFSYVNVLIPKKYLLPTSVKNRLKIHLVKRHNNNNSSLCCHPQCKFQVQSINDQLYYCNPIDIHLDRINKLMAYSDGTQQLK